MSPGATQGHILPGAGCPHCSESLGIPGSHPQLSPEIPKCLWLWHQTRWASLDPIPSYPQRSQNVFGCGTRLTGHLRIPPPVIPRDPKMSLAVAPESLGIPGSHPHLSPEIPKCVWLWNLNVWCSAGLCGLPTPNKSLISALLPTECFYFCFAKSGWVKDAPAPQLVLIICHCRKRFFLSGNFLGLLEELSPLCFFLQGGKTKPGICLNDKKITQA